MRDNLIWALKADQVRQELRKGVRLDGRKLDEFREIKAEKNISENANGSCRLFIGDTRVVVGTKFEVMTPYPDLQDQGSISVGFEFPPLASPSFESGPPSINSIELSRVVDRGIRESKAVNFYDLCLEEGEKSLLIFIDGYIENDEGNLFDAASLSSIIALSNTRMPKLDSEFKMVKKEYDGLLKLGAKPVMITFGKIGDKIIVDPTLAEHNALDARLSVSITEKDIITAIQKGLAGSFSKDEVMQCVDLASSKAKTLRKLI